jgi:hypothetical protein
MRSITEHDLGEVTWRKSSYSGGDGGNCLELAAGHPTLVPVRDSKNPTGPKLAFRPTAWTAFIENFKDHTA